MFLQLSSCHPTYIWQVECGEKNATLDSIERITSALKVPLSQLFEKLDASQEETHSIPLACYEFIAAKSEAEQEHLFRILLEIDRFKAAK